MISIKHILCPVDSSDFSQRALRYGAKLASWFDAELVALSVRPSFMPAMPLEFPLLSDPDTVQRRDESLRAFVQDSVGGTAARIVAVEGAVVEQILTVAGDLPADLIVMGTHGHSGFERLLLGSVTERVMRKAPCPVLTVPRLTTEAAVTFKTIVCAVDFSDASRCAIQYALSLAQESGGRLLLVHVLESFAEETSRLNAHYDYPEARRALALDAETELETLIPDGARTWCEPEVVLRHGKAYVEILRVASQQQADLIVLGVRGRGAIDLALFGSTAQHVARAAHCPVLTVGSDAAMTTHCVSTGVVDAARVQQSH